TPLICQPGSRAVPSRSRNPSPASTRQKARSGLIHPCGDDRCPSPTPVSGRSCPRPPPGAVPSVGPSENGLIGPLPGARSPCANVKNDRLTDGVALVPVRDPWHRGGGPGRKGNTVQQLGPH